MGAAPLPPPLTAVLLFLFAFLCGSLPLSVWMGRLFLEQDIRQVGDGNPGATNLLRAGGWRLGLAALFLDVFKGALPTGLAYFTCGVRGPVMMAIALAPSLGHGFSPFLGGRGGKALATVLGAWIGLTLGEVPVIILTFLVLWFALLQPEGWAVLLTAGGTLAHLLRNHPDPLLIAILLAQTGLVAWKHRTDLQKPVHIRPWVWRLFPHLRKSPKSKPWQIGDKRP